MKTHMEIEVDIDWEFTHDDEFTINAIWLERGESLRDISGVITDQEIEQARQLVIAEVERMAQEAQDRKEAEIDHAYDQWKDRRLEQ